IRGGQTYSISGWLQSVFAASMWMQQWTRDVVRFVTFSLSVVSWIANGFSIRPMRCRVCEHTFDLWMRFGSPRYSNFQVFCDQQAKQRQI
uniref:Secreted protein n=1 Tax=Parascaris univalens TaxID=6257 RepID=A0A915A4S3_PARUN